MTNYYEELLLYVRGKVSSKDHAQDIVQESYTRAIAMQAKQEINNQRALLYKIAKNLIIDKLRSSRVVSEVAYEETLLVPSALEPEEAAMEQSRETILKRELKKMPPKRQEVFVLHILEGYSRQEVARMLGISSDAVDKHLSRAIMELKEKLNPKKDRS